MDLKSQAEKLEKRKELFQEVKSIDLPGPLAVQVADSKLRRAEKDYSFFG